MTAVVANNFMSVANIARPSAIDESDSAQSDSGWRARISCGFEAGPSKTFVRRDHVGPLSMQRPFYPEGRTAHVYLLHPPGGVVGGDRLNVDVSASDGASGLITTPGATKFYRSEGRVARVNQNLHALGDLEWFPQENIFFNASNVIQTTDINVEEKGTLAFWEINCYGRLAGKQPFVEGRVVTRLSVRRKNCLVFHDRFSVDGQQSLNRTTGLRGSTVSGMLLLSPLPTESKQAALSLFTDSPHFSCSCIDDMLIVRYVGDSAEQAKAGFTQVWSQQRMALSRRAPCVPRIWST